MKQFSISVTLSHVNRPKAFFPPRPLRDQHTEYPRPGFGNASASDVVLSLSAFDDCSFHNDTPGDEHVILGAGGAWRGYYERMEKVAPKWTSKSSLQLTTHFTTSIAFAVLTPIPPSRRSTHPLHRHRRLDPLLRFQLAVLGIRLRQRPLEPPRRPCRAC